MSVVFFFVVLQVRVMETAEEVSLTQTCSHTSLDVFTAVAVRRRSSNKQEVELQQTGSSGVDQQTSDLKTDAATSRRLTVLFELTIQFSVT